MTPPRQLPDGTFDLSQEEIDAYRLVIYQNDYYVSALLQQLLDIGLPIEEFRKAVNAQLRSGTVEGAGTMTAGLNLKLPGTPLGLSADANGEVRGTSGENTNAENESQLTTKYTQANYLHNVRRELAKRHLIRTIKDDADLEDLNPGAFVEYEATFQANDLSTILELVNADIVAAFVSHQHRKKAVATYDWDEGNFEGFKVHAEKMKLALESKLEISVALTKAVKQDFRNDTSREYFGLIDPSSASNPSDLAAGGSLTAVTICDTQFFTSEDRDRILDGRFRVLGKVVEVSQESESILKRNKLLKRVGPEALEYMETTMAENPAAQMFDTDLRLVLDGPIMRVIPIAIYV